MAQRLKCLPPMRETWVRSLDWEDSLEEGMETHSSILAWRIPMDRGAWRASLHDEAEPDMTEQLSLLFLMKLIAFILFTLLFLILEKAMAPHSRALAWKLPWMEEPGRLQSVGSRRVGHD